MTILHIILAWFAVFIALMMWMRVRDNVREGRRLWDFGYFNFLAGSLVTAAAVWTIIAFVRPEPAFESDEEQIAYGNRTHQPWIANEALLRKADSAPHDIDVHFQLLRNHFRQRDEQLRNNNGQAYNHEDALLYTLYSDMSQSTDQRLHDIGHVMLAYYFVSQIPAEYSVASTHLHLVEDPTTKYVNYIAGKIILFGAGSELAEEHFYSEIRNKGFKSGAYELLAITYEHTGNDSALQRLIYSGANEFIPASIRSRVYYQNRDFAAFYALKLKTITEDISIWGWLGGSGILLIWLFFLRTLLSVSEMTVRHLLFPIIAGAVLAMGSWWLYAFYRYGLEFWMTGDIVNDFIFCFAGIGFIEELVKLIPFLLVLHFTRHIRRPVDYIVIASACGLGFAVFENFLYIANYGLDVIHSRALTSSVSHMACSGIVAYGFILRRYRWPQRWWLIPLFFLLASLAHGFYDFWLLSEKVQTFGIITLFFFLSEILIYFSFINNAMNQSVDMLPETQDVHFIAQRMTSILSGSFVLLFTFEYLAICLVYGTAYGNASLTTAFLSGGYLVFFLSVRMSQIRIQPGVWNRINILSGILPSRLIDQRDKE